MQILVLVVVLAAGLVSDSQPRDPELAGSWVGAVDSNRGQMDIGLSLAVRDGKLTGVVKTAHGDWTVTAVTEKDGQWTVAFKGADNEGRMIGRIKNDRFAGEWKSMMAEGTFEMNRAKAKR